MGNAIGGGLGDLGNQLANAFKAGHKIGSGTQADNSGLMTKAEVNYRPEDQTGNCASCVHFDGTNKCDIVAGKISGSMVCDKFEAAQSDSAAPISDTTTSAPTGNVPAGP